MNVKFLIIIGLLLAGMINSNLNNCATAIVADKMPVKPSDCYSDVTSSEFNCCYLATTSYNIKSSMCISLPKGMDTSTANILAKEIGATAEVICSNGSYFKMSLLLLLALIIL